MSLVPSLLQAIVRVDGDALVMHAGDKPYVVTPTGQVDLASRGLNLDAVNGIVNELLPPELQHALEEFGAVQYELPPAPEFPGEHFTVVVARGGDDVWTEVRRRRVPDDDRVPDDMFGPSASPPESEDGDTVELVAGGGPLEFSHADLNSFDAPGEARLESAQETIAPAAHITMSPPVAVAASGDDDLLLPDETQLFGGAPEAAVEAAVEAAPAVVNSDLEFEIDEPIAAETPAPPPVAVKPPPIVEAPAPVPIARQAPPAPLVAPPVTRVAAPPVLPAPLAVRPIVPVVAAPVRPAAPPVVQQPTAAPIPPPIARKLPVPPQAPLVQQPVAPPLTHKAAAPAMIPLAPMPVAVVTPEPMAVVAPEPVAVVVPEPVAVVVPEPVAVVAPEPVAVVVPEPVAVVVPEPVAVVVPEPVAVVAPPPVAVVPPPIVAPPIVAPPIAPQPAAIVSPPIAEVRAPHAEPQLRSPRLAPPPQPAVVLPILRNPIRNDQPPPISMGDPTLSGLERLLRLSAARGASTLYLSSQSRASVRVDGELQMLDGEPVLTARDVESLLLTLMPERSHEALRTGAATEWICDIEGVGRVRCMSFRDHRGPGGVFRMMPTRSVSADQLGLPPQVQALAIEPEGLVLVAGPRSSGKRTLMSAFVDLMNHARRDHVITIEREINIVHERDNCFISQREVRGNDEDMLAAARAALREDPDVLVIEDLRTGALMNVGLEAAASGHLVLGGFSAHTATGAIDRIIDLYAPEYRRQVQLALADSLRGVIVQVLLKKTGGGRLPAREVLLNTPSVSGVIAEGKTSQLPMAIEGGRRYGMVPLNDTLVGLVQSGAVDGREVYRHSPDRPGLLAALVRQGVDTSFIERLA
jgi:twitching motility protein PilT